ncbi:MAG: hypothetical protein AAGL99_07185 [Pseudomonadota bacterium]
MSRWLVGFFFTLGIAACEVSPSLPDSENVNIASLAWLDASADKVEHLAFQPSTCLRTPGDPAVQRGALMFSSPTLLGGQAAKVGLSCAACHRNGRGNPDFVFTGISGAPGTADVTHGLFSNVRADRVFNPVPIPDLASPDGRRLVDREVDGALEAFLSAQIVEEFSGSEQEDRVISDLAAYIRVLDDRVCDAHVLETQSWREELNLVRAIIGSDPPISAAHTNAMRAALGRIHERLLPNAHFDLRDDTVTLSRALDRGQDRKAIIAMLDQLEVALQAVDAQTLYNPTVLARVLPQ